jgi:hypothetical protein
MQPDQAVFDRPAPVRPARLDPVGQDDRAPPAWREPPEGRAKMPKTGMTIDASAQTLRKGRIDQEPRCDDAGIEKVIDKFAVMACETRRGEAMREKSRTPRIDFVQDKASACMGSVNGEKSCPR